MSLEVSLSELTFQNSSDSESSKLFPAAADEYRYVRYRCEMLCRTFNALPLTASWEGRAKAWHNIVNPSNMHDETATEMAHVKTPTTIDYGVNVHKAPSSLINRDFFIADTPDHAIRIGERTLIGPRVSVFGVSHPVDWRVRDGREGPSLGAPATIGNDCWIGGSSIVLAGITIGDGCITGAGSVVSRSIAAYHVAVGNPAGAIWKVARDVPDAPGLQYRGKEENLLTRSMRQAAEGESLTAHVAPPEVVEVISVAAPLKLVGLVLEIALLVVVLLVAWCAVHQALS